MTQAELAAKIREVALVLVLAFCAIPVYLGYWVVVRGDYLRSHPKNARSAVRSRHVMPGRILTSDGEEVLGRRKAGEDEPWQHTYPSPTTFCHLTGYRYKGVQTGLQGALRRHLVDAALRRSPLDALTQPQPIGNDVELTIDADGQRVARNRLVGRKGAVVALDPRTGAILVLASAPTYKPEDVTLNDINYIEFNKHPDSPELNRALQGLYPPGSIFKVITAAAALEGAKASVDLEYECRGSIDIGDRTMGCWKEGGHGTMDMASAVANSCVVYFAQLGEALGTRAMSKYAKGTGIFDGPRLPLPAETSRLDTEETDDLAAAGYANGQSDIMITPLAAARIAAAVANGGMLHDPYIVGAVMDPEGRVVEQARPSAERRAIQPSTAEVLAGMMELAVESGTAENAAVRGFTVAGKTGSAQNHPERAAHAWFIGFAPVAEPRVAVAVVIENGGSGGAAAAPIAAEVLGELLR